MDIDLNTLMWKVYRRGVFHGGTIAIVTAAVWLIM
jgi:hypothetical protein